MNGKNKETWVFRLFVSGKSPRTEQALETLRQICENHLEGNCDIAVIDVRADPAAAVSEDVIATPTLLKKLPEPVRKIIGDLWNREKVRLALDIVNGEREE